MLAASVRWSAWLFVCATCAISLIAAADDVKGGLIYPNGLAIDRDGNLFISDVGAHRIFKLGRDRKLTVIAGTGHQGFSGDNGPAADAQLSAPSDLAFDAQGNLLVADSFNHRIRRIDRRGVITTIVGDAKNTLNNPQGIALDADGNLFIADTYNHVVRKLDRNGTVTTFAGTEAGLAGDKGAATKAQLNLPQAVAVAPDGSVYISDGANSRIRRVSADGIIQTIAGFGPGSGEGGAGFAGDGGPAERAKLFTPADLEFTPTGQLYVSDSGNNRIRLITHGLILTIAGSGKPAFGGEGGKAVQAMLNTPQKLAVAKDGTIYVADRVNHRVRKIDPQGLITTVAGQTVSEGIMVDPSVIKTRQ